MWRAFGALIIESEFFYEHGALVTESELFLPT
jgi:hypothetical protein